MTVWEMRQYVEERIPWWVPFVASGIGFAVTFAIGLCVCAKAGDRK